MVKFLEKKNNLIMSLILSTIISYIIRLIGINNINGDYTNALSVWFDFLKYNGGFKALSADLGVYNVPYLVILASLSYLPLWSLYSIKFISIIFDYILAVSIGILVYEILKENKNVKIYACLAYICVIFLPTVFLNSGFWAQCDSIYTSFIVISLIFLVKEKYFRSFLFLGIAFAFKLQFIFILPLYIAVYIGNRKFPIYYFLIIFIVNFVMCLPAIIAGRDIINCMLIYFNQTGLEKWSDFEYISMNFPGIYNLILDVPVGNDNLVPNYNFIFSKIMIFITMGIFAISFLHILIKKINFNNKLIIEYGIWSVLICTFFLPHMHDRYMYIAEVLSIVYVMYGNRLKLIIPIVLQVCSITSYLFSLFSLYIIPIQIISIMNMGVLIIITYILIRSFRNINVKLIGENSIIIEGEIKQ